MTPFQMKEKLQSIQQHRIRLSTQLEEAVKRESAEKSKLMALGIVDPVASISSLSAELASLNASIESSLQDLERSLGLASV